MDGEHTSYGGRTCSGNNRNGAIYNERLLSDNVKG